MRRRINITLTDETVKLIDRVAARGDRSRFIAEAVSHYVSVAGRAQLRKRLKEGALRRAERDRRLVSDWFLLETTSPTVPVRSPSSRLSRPRSIRASIRPRC